MWSRYEKEQGMERGCGQWEVPWPCTEILKTLAELNEQCLELLTEQALHLPAAQMPSHTAQHPLPPAHMSSHTAQLASHTAQLPAPASIPMLDESRDLWRRLDAESRRRAAACPFLLVDAGFADPYRWRWVSTHRVGDREPAFAPFFCVPGLMRVAHQVFNNAWYIARADPAAAPLFLGMPAPCVALLRACTLRQLTELGERHASWLRPRWTGRPRVWRELLSAAIANDARALERARLHGVQLLATELRALAYDYVK